MGSCSAKDLATFACQNPPVVHANQTQCRESTQKNGKRNIHGEREREREREETHHACAAFKDFEGKDVRAKTSSTQMERGVVWEDRVERTAAKTSKHGSSYKQHSRATAHALCAICRPIRDPYNVNTHTRSAHAQRTLHTAHCTLHTPHPTPHTPLLPAANPFASMARARWEQEGRRRGLPTWLVYGGSRRGGAGSPSMLTGP